MPVVSKVKSIWGDIVEDVKSNGGIEVSMTPRDMGVILLTAVLLTLFYYYGRPTYFRSHWQVDFWALIDMERSHPFSGMFAYWYWGIASTFLRIVIPLGVIIWIFKESPRDYGFRIWEKGHAWIYLFAYLFMLPILIGMSFSPKFQKKYPFYDQAGDSVLHFVLYEIPYGIQFFSLEAFFRGFFIFALFKRFGYYGVAFMTIPYCMIHFGKPISETLGAIVAGLVLGYLALKSKSWLPGALLHWGVGITMDLACIIQRLLKQ